MQAKRDNEPHAQRTEPHKTSPFRFGSLKNGNRPGNPMLSPRCGAKSKRTALPCRQPAMPNGKCRLHGGFSTGPKTPEGLSRSRKANWQHGEFSQRTKQEQRRTRAFFKETKAFLREILENNPKCV